MAQEFEYEAKTLLSSSDFSKLLHFLHMHNEVAVTQHNHYFETPDFLLRSAGSALRIREKNGASVLTLKQPTKDGGLLETHQSLSEKEKELALSKDSLPSGEILNQLQTINVVMSHVEHLGTLTTERIEIPYLNGSICLDKSSYLGEIDYEVEYEGTSIEHANCTLAKLLEEVNIPQVETPNKVARFFMKKTADANKEKPS